MDEGAVWFGVATRGIVWSCYVRLILTWLWQQQQQQSRQCSLVWSALVVFTRARGVQMRDGATDAEWSAIGVAVIALSVGWR